VEVDGQVSLDATTITAASGSGVHALGTATVTATNGTIISTSGTGITLDNSSTGTVNNATVTGSTGNGIVLNGLSVATLNAGATVTMSGGNGVFLAPAVALLPAPAPGPALNANAGSSITLNTGNGIDAEGGAVTLTGASVTSNGDDGVLVQNDASLSCTGATIDTNGNDGVHTLGTGDITIDTCTIGTATLANNGNSGIGIDINGDHANPVMLTNVLVSRNRGAGMVLASEGGATKIYSLGSHFDHNQNSGVIAVNGRIALRDGSVNNNTGNLTIGGNTLPAAAVGVASTPLATVTLEGDPNTRITVNGNFIGVLSAGNFAGINVELGGNLIHGMVVLSPLPRAARAFPQTFGGSPNAFEDSFSTATANVHLHDAWLRNFFVHDNGAAATAAGLPGGGIAVLRTSDVAVADNTALASSFQIGVDTRPPSGTFIRDNTGTGLTIGGPVAPLTNPTNGDEFCNVILQPPFNAFGLTCGPVDASVADTFLFRNDRGIVLQNGGVNDDGDTTNDGLATAVHIVRNTIYSNDIVGVLTRPSAFVQGQNITGLEALRFNQNAIFQNDPSEGAAGAEIEFDATAFVGAPAPTNPVLWVIGDATLSSEFDCGNKTNSILGYRCNPPPPPAPQGHVALRSRNNASVRAENVKWQRDPATLGDVNLVNNGTVDFSPACAGFDNTCELPADQP
jgi:hypothetical protein